MAQEQRVKKHCGGAQLVSGPQPGQARTAYQALRLPSRSMRGPAQMRRTDSSEVLPSRLHKVMYLHKCYATLLP